MKIHQYQIYKNFDRLSQEEIAKFRDIPTTIIGDCLNKTAGLPSNLSPLNSTKLLGSAYTVKVTPGDNSLVYYAIDNAQAGDVIVVDGASFKERALIGELMVQLAIKRNLAGIIINGALRDAQEISQLELPVYAITTTSNGPIRNIKNGTGTVNLPISIGGRIVHPGDILVGDQSGIVSFQPDETKELLTNSQKMLAKEEETVMNLEKNHRLDLSWLYDGLEKTGSPINDKIKK